MLPASAREAISASFGYHRVSSQAFSQKVSFDQPGARMKVIRPELRKACNSCSRVVRRVRNRGMSD
jgi:hypothetical protein